MRETSKQDIVRLCPGNCPNNDQREVHIEQPIKFNSTNIIYCTLKRVFNNSKNIINVENIVICTKA